jgi:hypothetical protein
VEEKGESERSLEWLERACQYTKVIVEETGGERLVKKTYRETLYGLEDLIRTGPK